MTKARSSLTFKGPANETRIRRPPNLPAPLAKPPTSEKQKTVRKVARSVEKVDEDASALKVGISEKQKGKRRAIEVEPVESREDASRRDLNIVHYEASTSSSTVDKTWKPLSRSAKDELSKLATQTESEITAMLKGSSSKSDFRDLLATYRSSFNEALDDLVCPPVPSTLKPRNASKNSIDFVDSETVKKKISATRLALDKEEESIKEMEEELERLRPPESRAKSEMVESDEDEEDEPLVVLPVKKKQKKTVSQESHQIAVPRPSPIVAKPRKPILKPSLSVPRADEEDDSDEFDTFPRPPSKAKTTASKAMSKSQEGSAGEGRKGLGTKGTDTKQKKVRHIM
ncbi:hypothetical protein JCM5353_000512 [Sporobolomyces roseus]